MFKPDRGSSIRQQGFVALALAVAVLGLQAPAAFALDRARVDQDAERGDAAADRGRQGRGAERHGGFQRQAQAPQQTPQQAPQFQAQQAPAAPMAPPVRRQDSRPSPAFGSSPSVVPPLARERGEFRRPPGGVFAPPPRGPDLRAAPPLAARGFDYRPRPERIVPRVPPGYREYRWGGVPYYHYGDRWYRPYGSSFLIVGAPFGLFVPYLPAYYTTFWFGGTRYFMADETYYLYDPVRRGYIVTRSPYGGDRDLDDDEGDRDQVSSSAELYIYPMRGQSESQQAEDRYQCHRWAADQVHYDPTESEYRAAERAEYDRAMAACLTGRGYSVK